MTILIDEKVYCPFCGLPLQLRVKDGIKFVPSISKPGMFQVKCRTKTCCNVVSGGRWVDIDMVQPVLLA